MRIEYIYWAGPLCVVLTIILNIVFILRLAKYNQEIYQEHKEYITNTFWFLNVALFFPRKELKNIDKATRFIWVINLLVCVVFFVLFIYMIYPARAS